MTTEQSWDLSNSLVLAMKTTEKCPAYLQFTSTKGEQYGRAPRKICMFPETWDALRKLEPALVEALWGSRPVIESWTLPSTWEIEVGEFKETKYVCFSQWNFGDKLPRFNMSRDEYEALLQVSDDINAAIKEMQDLTRVSDMQNPPFKENLRTKTTKKIKNI
jgi:hypothetical protein